MAKKTEGKFSVVFTGFHTEKQAREFASWYEGSGEQDAFAALGFDTTVDMEKLAKMMPKESEELNGAKRQLTLDGGPEEVAIVMPLEVEKPQK